MSNIKRFKDKDGNYIYPVTHVSAVFDSNGNTIEDLAMPTKLSQLQNDTSYVTEDYVTKAINNAQLGNDVGNDGAVTVLGKDVILTEHIADNQITYSKLSKEIIQFERTGTWYVEYAGEGPIGCPVFSTDSLKSLSAGDTINIKFTIDNISMNMSNIYTYIIHADAQDTNLNKDIDGTPGFELNFKNGIFEIDYILTKDTKEYMQLLVVANSEDKELVKFIISDVKINDISLNELNYFYLSNPTTLSLKKQLKKFDTDLITKEYLDKTLYDFTPTTKYTNKIIGTFGDSLTDGYIYTNNTRYDNNEGKYQQTMIDMLGCETINFGISGSDILILWQVIQGIHELQALTSNNEWYKPIPDFANMDAVTIMIGTNEITNGQQGTIEDIQGEDYTQYPETYYGTYGKCIEYILEKNPKIRIYLMTPPWCDRGYIGAVEQRVKEIARYYHLPIIDCYNESGLNKYNQETYMPDKLHQNEEGVKVLGTFISGQLLSK